MDEASASAASGSPIRTTPRTGPDVVLRGGKALQSGTAFAERLLDLGDNGEIAWGDGVNLDGDGVSKIFVYM